MASKYILGVDVGTSSVKVLAAAKEGGKVLIKGSGAVPTAGFVKGAVTDVDALAAAIEGAIDCAVMAAGVPRENIYLGIGGMEITSQSSIGSVNSSSGVITTGDIERACRAATIIAVPDDHRILHVLPTAYWLDGNKEAASPLGKKGTRLDVDAYIVAAPRAAIDQLTQALAARGLNVTGVMANAIVSGAALAAGGPACIIMDIGAGLSDIAIYSRGQISMSASIPLGGDYITADITQGVGVSQVHAEEIKRYYAKLDKNLKGRDVVLDCNDYGTTDKEVAYDFLHTIVDSRVEEIISLLHLYLEPALVRYQPEKIILIGGSALLPSIGEWTEKIFAMPVESGNPGAALEKEYAYPGNLACYGLIQYALHLAPEEPAADSGGVRSFFRKLKEFI